MKYNSPCLLALLVAGLLSPSKLIAATGTEPHATRIVLVGDSTVAPGSGWGNAYAGLLNGAGGNKPGATIPPDKTFTNLDFEVFPQVVDLNLQGTVLGVDGGFTIFSGV